MTFGRQGVSLIPQVLEEAEPGAKKKIWPFQRFTYLNKESEGRLADNRRGAPMSRQTTERKGASQRVEQRSVQPGAGFPHRAPTHKTDVGERSPQHITHCNHVEEVAVVRCDRKKGERIMAQNSVINNDLQNMLDQATVLAHLDYQLGQQAAEQGVLEAAGMDEQAAKMYRQAYAELRSNQRDGTRVAMFYGICQLNGMVQRGCDIKVGEWRDYPKATECVDQALALKRAGFYDFACRPYVDLMRQYEFVDVELLYYMYKITVAANLFEHAIYLLNMANCLAQRAGVPVSFQEYLDELLEMAENVFQLAPESEFREWVARLAGNKYYAWPDGYPAAMTYITEAAANGGEILTLLKREKPIVEQLCGRA